MEKVDVLSFFAHCTHNMQKATLVRRGADRMEKKIKKWRTEWKWENLCNNSIYIDLEPDRFFSVPRKLVHTIFQKDRALSGLDLHIHALYGFD